MERCDCGKLVFALGTVWVRNGQRVAPGEGVPLQRCNECAEALWARRASAIFPSPTMLADSLWGSRRLWERTPEVHVVEPWETCTLVSVVHVLMDPFFERKGDTL